MQAMTQLSQVSVTLLPRPTSFKAPQGMSSRYPSTGRPSSSPATGCRARGLAPQCRQRGLKKGSQSLIEGAEASGGAGTRSVTSQAERRAVATTATPAVARRRGRAVQVRRRLPAAAHTRLKGGPSSRSCRRSAANNRSRSGSGRLTAGPPLRAFRAGRLSPGGSGCGRCRPRPRGPPRPLRRSGPGRTRGGGRRAAAPAVGDRSIMSSAVPGS